MSKRSRYDTEDTEVESPTPDRPSWLIRFPYSVRDSDGTHDAMIEVEHAPCGIYLIDVRDVSTDEELTVNEDTVLFEEIMIESAVILENYQEGE